MTDPGRERLMCYNYLNAVAYLTNLFVVYGIGVLGWFDLPDNAELSAKYQTLVTPAGFSFAIWAVIFVAQAFFAIAQLLTTFRSVPIVQRGIRFWYGLACAFQIGWTLAFSFEKIWMSCIFMFFILFSLCGLLLNQRLAGNSGTVKEYWLLRFPFQIHTGWICAASALNVNVVLVKESAEHSFQVFAAVGSLLVLLGTALVLLLRTGKERELNVVIPLVLSWAFGGIWAELTNPKQSIQDKFDISTINGLKVSAAIACIVVFVVACIKTAWRFIRKDNSIEESSAVNDNVFADPEGTLQEPPSLT
eukprot:CAMPEP_0197456720 /NCGR_PEP_ID=MMETSP1175-20131217/44081_1 /TAXON_ID=1003142 /ORGANISM="Triceratium dubium, Strain CCMP147" /LENGTH=304 /DNA_ID=CAMNT_0042990861 /DNA_START=252 /DNA_END=1166 /DNA_ORIENTATION=+